MRDKIRPDKSDIVFEALLKVATDEALRIEMDSLPTDDELKAMYPDTSSLDKKVHALINKEYNKSKRARFLHSLTRVAAIFCIITVFSTGLLMAAPASRNAILNFLIDIRSDHIVFDFGIDPIQHEGNFVFRHVPEGFTLTNYRITDEATTYIFENADGCIIVMNRRLGYNLQVGISNEYAHFSEITLMNGEAFIFEAINEGDLSTIMWVRGKYVYLITTSLDTEVLITLAEIYMAN